MMSEGDEPRLITDQPLSSTPRKRRRYSTHPRVQRTFRNLVNLEKKLAEQNQLSQAGPEVKAGTEPEPDTRPD